MGWSSVRWIVAAAIVVVFVCGVVAAWAARLWEGGSGQLGNQLMLGSLAAALLVLVYSLVSEFVGSSA